MKGNEMADEAADLENVNLLTHTIENTSSNDIFTFIHKNIFSL